MSNDWWQAMKSECTRSVQICTFIEQYVAFGRQCKVTCNLYKRFRLFSVSLISALHDSWLHVIRPSFIYGFHPSGKFFFLLAIFIKYHNKKINICWSVFGTYGFEKERQKFCKWLTFYFVSIFYLLVVCNRHYALKDEENLSITKKIKMLSRW